MMKVYLAGPMSGLPDYNVPAFEKWAAELRARGYEVVSPAECDNTEGQENDALRAALAADPKVGPSLRAQYLRRDFTLLLGCEAIVLLPGWNHSTGATCEALVAAMAGLKAFEAVDGPHHLLLYEVGPYVGGERYLSIDGVLISDHVWRVSARAIDLTLGDE